MKNIRVKNKQNIIISDGNKYELENVQNFLDMNISNGSWGKPERWVREKVVSENPEDEIVYLYPDGVYEEIDVLESETRAVSGFSVSGSVNVVNVIDVNYVLLRADYTIEITDYVPPVPREVTMRQARIALTRQGLYDTIQTAVNNSLDEELKIEWEYSQIVQRDWASLIALTTSLGMTANELDDLFRLAATL